MYVILFYFLYDKNDFSFCVSSMSLLITSMGESFKSKNLYLLFSNDTVMRGWSLFTIKLSYRSYVLYMELWRERALVSTNDRSDF